MIARAGSDSLTSPDWLLAGFDLQKERYHLAKVNRGTYHTSAFLDHRIQPLPTETLSLSGIEVDEALQDTARKHASWIFHTGFCGSTLLANCLDHPGMTLVLREPLVLSRLAQSVRNSSVPDSAAMHGLVSRVIRLCERSYPGEACIVKPSNFANALIPVLLLSEERGPQARKVILMSCSLDALLLSILKKKAEAEILLQGFLRSLLQDSDYLAHAEVPNPAGLDLLQQSVLFWHCQRYYLQQRMAQSATETFRLLSMERFLAEPEIVLPEVSDFLQLGLAGKLLKKTIADGAFRRHSKQANQNYDREIHQRDQQATRLAHAQELDATLAWAEPLLQRLPITPFDHFETVG